MYEAGHAALQPARALADITRLAFKNPFNPLAHTTYGKSMAAAAELFERSTRRYAKPNWGIDYVLIGGERAIHIATVWGGRSVGCCISNACFVICRGGRSPSFRCRADVGPLRDAVARYGRGLPAEPRRLSPTGPMRMVPVTDGASISTPSTTSSASCTSRRRHACRRGVPASVPVLAATALMESDGDRHAPPQSADGGPIDTAAIRPR
jgi:poly(3-hydroxybutyrate) depolymerase